MTEAELKQMTVKQLRDLATEKTEISGVKGMKKDELVSSLIENLDISTDESAPATGKKSVKLDSKSSKKEIMRLKQKQTELLSSKAKNPGQMKNLRRRIRSLKRIMRKVS